MTPTTITRRAIIKGASATAAAMATAKAAAPAPDVAALIRRWQTLNADLEQRGKALDAREAELYSTEPQRPACAGHAIAWPGGELECPSDGWTVEALVATRSQFRIERTDEAGVQTVRMWDERLPPAALAKIQRVQEEIAAYEIAKAAHWRAHIAAMKEWEASISTVDAALMDIVQHVPRDRGELMAKIAFLQACPLLADYQDPDALTALARTLMRDVTALV